MIQAVGGVEVLEVLEKNIIHISYIQRPTRVVLICAIGFLKALTPIPKNPPGACQWLWGAVGSRLYLSF